jgi:hypothetical protein
MPETETPAMTTTTEPAPAAADGSMSAAEVTGLVTLFTSMLHTSTVQIIGRMDDNARMASERWVKHDIELERNRETVVARFLKVETALDAHLVVANAHFVREHDEDLVMDARVRPVKTSLAYVVAHWKTAALVILSVVGLLGVWLDFIRDARLF